MEAIIAGIVEGVKLHRYGQAVPFGLSSIRSSARCSVALLVVPGCVTQPPPIPPVVHTEAVGVKAPILVPCINTIRQSRQRLGAVDFVRRSSCYDSSNRLVGDIYAALRCLPRTGWKAIQHAATRRPRRFGRQCIQSVRQHDEGQQQLELPGLRQLDVPEHDAWSSTERMGCWRTTGRLAGKMTVMHFAYKAFTIDATPDFSLGLDIVNYDVTTGHRS
jgi:hypothetical protein